MYIVFDLTIAGFLIIDGALILHLILQTVKEFSALKLAAAIALFCAWAVIFYGSFIEPRVIVVKNQDIKIGSKPTEMIRAAVFSDLHIGPFKQRSFVERVAAKTLKLKPDIIFIIGDFVHEDYDLKKELAFLEPLKKLKAELGVFAVMGNHDYGRIEDGFGKTERAIGAAVKQTLESYGITVLVNEGRMVRKGKTEFTLLGLDDLWTWRSSINKALASIKAVKTPRPSILLSHNADVVRIADKKHIDLQISAHTHGGQIRLPFIGPVPALPHNLGRKYDQGLFQFGNTRLFITSGIGEINARARLLDPPEIVLMNISL